MPSTDDPGPIDGLTYTAAEWRRMEALSFAANGTAGGAVVGVRPGDPGLAVTLAGSVITVAPGIAALFHAAFGTYKASLASPATLNLTAASITNPRIDLVYLRVWDNAVDGAGLSQADAVYLAGTANIIPVAPTPGALEIYIPLAQISVPKSGGGPASVTPVKPVLIAPGGILPASSTANGAYIGQWRLDPATGQLWSWTGIAWEGVVRLAGQLIIGGSTSGAALAVQLAAATSGLLAGRVAGDTQNRYFVEANGMMQWGSGSAVADTTLERSAAGALKITGGLQVTTMGSVEVTDGTTRTTTSTTYATLAGLTATMTVPPSGRVRALLRASFRNSSTPNSLMSMLANGSVSGANFTPSDLSAIIVGGTSNYSLSMEKILVGLTPGETVTVVRQGRVAASSTLTCDYSSIILTPELA